jgi:hypothetical protein
MHAADNVRHATCTTQRATINDAQRMRRMQRATYLLGATHIYNACNAQPLTPVGSRRCHLSVYIVYIYSAACLRRVPPACAECNGLTHTPAAFGPQQQRKGTDPLERTQCAAAQPITSWVMPCYRLLPLPCGATDYTGCVTDHCRRSPTRARCRCRCKLRCGRAGCSTRRFG